jgi:predicted NACHT family NTPase
MQKADYWLRLMKQRTDALMATDEKLQQFLMWVNEKSLSVNLPYKPAAVRAFYFAVALGRDLAITRDFDLYSVRDLARALKLDIKNTRDFDIALDLDMGRVFARALKLDIKNTRDFDIALDLDMGSVFARTTNRDRSLELGRAFARVLALPLKSEIKQALQELKKQLPDPGITYEISRQWWRANGQAWTEQLRAVMIKHRNIGHDWQFSERQKESLRHYYDANKLLVDCLNNNSDVTSEVRSHLEDTLLVPIAEIQKYR